MAEHGEKALEIFTNFFISPLFSSSGTQREVQAVDSENSKNLVSDGRRRWQVLKSIASESHHFSKFSTGNKITLPACADDDEKSSDNEASSLSFEEIDGKPMYNAIMSTLISVLKPTSITLTDNSSQHAGHAGSKGWEESGESHFALEIVAEAFEGKKLVMRHQLIYMLLGDVMPKIHALEISAKAPSEV